MQAIILAAGMGKRLKHLTSNSTKCMVKVNQVTLIERTLGELDKLGLTRIVVVVGYEGEKLKSYIATLPVKTPVLYVENEIYDKTNNIFSLYLAREYLLKEDTLLLESDIIFEGAVLRRLLENPYPSLALVAKYESWMDGTVVTLDQDDNILEFIGKKQFDFTRTDQYYKTVNIYKFSREFSRTHYVPFLEAYCQALGNNEYYEQVLKVITLLDRPEIKGARLDKELWYEIDDEQDLDIAESLFAQKDEKLSRYQKRYGGYWRYPGLKDFCYLVNPFYPPAKLKAELKASFDTLLTNYPSGMEVNSLLAAKNFGLEKGQVCVGNGAAELIKAVMEKMCGTVGIQRPSFEEYPNRKEESKVITFKPENPNFSYDENDLMEFYESHPADMLVLVNPDNPSGNYISSQGIKRLILWTKQKNIRLLVDESFVDFAEEENATLLDSALLRENPHLIVVKSISKSYGVPGLRLGLLASGDQELIGALKKDVSIWNINSFGEYYLQICEKYKEDYRRAMEEFKEVRRRYVDELGRIEGLRVIPSQANYVMCELTGGISARQLGGRLLEKHDILIKDLSGKKGILPGKEYIRLAVKTPEENRELAEALGEELK